MISAAWSFNRLFIAPLAASAFLLAGCGGTPATQPTTTPEVSANAAKARPAPKPKKPELPPGLSLSGLGRIETRTTASPLQNLFALNRPEGEAPPVRVGLLLPLTGAAANAGTMMLDAAQMALFDSGERRLMLVPLDTESTPEGAQRAAQTAATQGVDIILGPLFSAHVQLVADTVASRNIPVLAFSNDVAAAGRNAAVLGLAPEAEIRRILEYASFLRLTEIGAFLPDSEYGLLIGRHFEVIAPELGLNPVRLNYYPAGAEADNETLLFAAKDFADYDLRRKALEEERALLTGKEDEASKRALKRMEVLDTFGDPPFQAVLLAEPRGRLATVAPLLAFYDVDPATVQFLGLGSWYGHNLQAEPTLVGAVFPGPEPQLYDTMTSRFSGFFGYEPGRLAAVAYDAVAMTASIVATKGGDRPLTNEAIHNPGGFAAYYGPFRVLPSGQTERLLPVLKVTRDGLQVADPARASFDALLN